MGFLKGGRCIVNMIKATSLCLENGKTRLFLKKSGKRL